MSAIEADEHKHEHKVVITVNNRDVTVEAPKNTGFGVKEAAIAQGVNIEADFQLAEVHGKRRMIIGDDDVITIAAGAKFVATAPDDNS
jgi:Multiubiquitin